VGKLLQGGQRPAARPLMARVARAFAGTGCMVELQRHPGEDGQTAAEQLTERGLFELAYVWNSAGRDE